MDLKELLKQMSADEQRFFAKSCETSMNYLKLIAYNAKNPSADLSIIIERESKGKVLCEDLRPAVDWSYIRGTKNLNKNVL